MPRRHEQRENEVCCCSMFSAPYFAYCRIWGTLPTFVTADPPQKIRFYGAPHFAKRGSRRAHRCSLLREFPPSSPCCGKRGSWSVCRSRRPPPASPAQAVTPQPSLALEAERVRREERTTVKSSAGEAAAAAAAPAAALTRPATTTALLLLAAACCCWSSWGPRSREKRPKRRRHRRQRRERYDCHVLLGLGARSLPLAAWRRSPVTSRRDFNVSWGCTQQSSARPLMTREYSKQSSSRNMAIGSALTGEGLREVYMSSLTAETSVAQCFGALGIGKSFGGCFDLNPTRAAERPGVVISSAVRICWPRRPEDGSEPTSRRTGSAVHLKQGRR